MATRTVAGTGFPGSPVTGQRFFRTDRGIEYYYDGTRWLSTQLFALTFHTDRSVSGITATLNIASVGNPHAGSYELWAIEVTVAKLLGGSGDWEILLQTIDGATTTQIAATGSFTNTTADHITIAIGASIASDVDYFNLRGVENSGTATMFGMGTLKYRLIG